MKNLVCLFALLTVFLAATDGVAQVSDGPIVSAYERFHRDEASEAGGRLLMGELNCTACHAIEDAQLLIDSKSAPDLTEMASRVRPEYLQNYLANPHALKPGTTMPDVLGQFSEQEKQEHIENLTHFLATTGTIRELPHRSGEIEKGKKLFHEVGCVACHGPQGETVKLPAGMKPIGDLSNKYSIASLAEFIRDPLKVRRSGRMPSLRLGQPEALSMARYLLGDVEFPVEEHIEFDFYDGVFEKLPDFSKLQPIESGNTDAFTVLKLREQSGRMGIVFRAELEIPRNGRYTFHLKSDDGSRLLIDDKEVVNVDGIHPATLRSKAIRLDEGVHSLRLEYFDKSGEAVLELKYDGPGDVRGAYVSDLVKSTKPSESTDREQLVIDPQRVEKGRIAFVELKCASCHKVGSRQPGGQMAGTMASLDAARGCLSEQPNGAPYYHLRDDQRESIATALKKLQTQPDKQPSKEVQVVHAMETFNCYACHERNQVGGVQPELSNYFLSTQAEMGDEGRIPPHLNGVGGKLTDAWLRKILREGAKDRPYMKTMMPQFAERNTGRLAALFQALDPVPELEPITPVESEGRFAAVGRHMVGDKVFGCIKCHTFNGQKASGVQGIDMTLMPQRVNNAWFHAYVIDPPKYRPGTRMPTAWPNGKSVMQNLLGGDSHQQLEAIWTYLEQGKDAKLPFGVGEKAIELTAWREAVIYRNFIEGAGNRAIGVGFPAKANIAFDAEKLRLALIWQGSFIDASRHWTGRGQGYQKPMGDNVIAFDDKAPIALLESATAPWPQETGRDAGLQFLGYQLGEKNQPTFRYKLDETEVAEAYTAEVVDSFPALKREVSIHPSGSAGDSSLYFRVVAGKEIKPLEDGWYQVDGRLKVHIQGATATLRESNELVIPIRERTDFAVQYIW